MEVVVAAQHGGPEVLRVEHRPDPMPGAGEVRVRVEAAGVNFIDVYHRTGAYAMEPPVPMGLEGAGVVEYVGEGVADLEAGDRVAWADVQGSYATHVVAPAAVLVPVPELLSTGLAAAVMLQGMTAHYLSHSSFHLRPGDECLVHAGAGGVGLLLIQMAKHCGARVLTTVSSAEKAEAARAAGADEVILYSRDDFVAEVHRLTEGRGVQVVFDGVGLTTFERGLDCLAPRGHMILYGRSSGPPAPLDPQVLSSKGSLYLQRPTLAHHTADRGELLERAAAVLSWVGEEGLQVRVAATFELAAAAEAHRALEGRSAIGKVLLSI